MLVSIERHRDAHFAIVSREENGKEFLIEHDDTMIQAAELLFGSKNQLPDIAAIVLSANVGRDLTISRETAKALGLLSLSPEEELIDKIRAVAIDWNDDDSSAFHCMETVAEFVAIYDKSAKPQWSLVNGS